jgi:hypothetical protein
MTAKQVAALAKSGEPTKKSDGKGLYFVVPDSGAPYDCLIIKLHNEFQACLAL